MIFTRQSRVQPAIQPAWLARLERPRRLIATYVIVAAATGLACLPGPPNSPCRQTLVNAMPERNWEREVHDALALEARREASILHNPKQAKLVIERGAAVALVVVLTLGVIRIPGLAPHHRAMFFTGSIFAAIISLTLVSIGLFALASQRLRKPAPPTRDDDSPAIGW
jgi:hypothetical protein